MRLYASECGGNINMYIHINLYRKYLYLILFYPFTLKSYDLFSGIACLYMYTYISQKSIYFTGPKTHSRLIVSDVIKEDSGNYTCSAPSTVSSSIDVFVSPGKFLHGVLTTC